MLADDFIPQKGLNSIFSELENFEVAQNPYDEGFLGQTATLRKRPGLLSSDDWQTVGTILGKVIYGGIAYFWDDEGNAYKFERILGEYVKTQIYDNSIANLVSVYTTNTYGNKAKQFATVMPYVTQLVKGWTADKVLSTNDNGSGVTVLVVNEAGTFTSASVGQYIYFTAAASANAKWQIRQISEFIDGKTVHLNEQFYADPAIWEVAEPGQTYETIDNVVVFNNLRNADGNVLCIGTVDNTDVAFRDLGGADGKIYEGRRWLINDYGTSIGGSFATGEYELLDPTTVQGSSTSARGLRMDSLTLFKNYLMINLENSISVVWNIGNTTEGIPIYNMNTILNGTSALGFDSIASKDGGMYFVGKDRIFNSGDINAVSTNIIEGITKNQGIVISKFLSEIQDSDNIRVYQFGKGIVIQRSNATATTMYMYDDIYEGWLPQIYPGLNIVDKFESFYGDLLIGVNNSICLRAGTSDLGADISVKCVVTGSKQIVNSQFSLKKIKLMLGYFYNVVAFKITVDLGKKVFIGTVEKRADGVDYLIWQNLAIAGGGIGSIPIGYNQLGGANNLQDKIAKVGLIGVPIGKMCTYYKITLENIDNYDLNITGITSLIESGNPYVTPLTNVF